MKNKLLLMFYLSFVGWSGAQTEPLPSVKPDTTTYKAKPYLGVQVGFFGAGLQFSYPINNRFSVRVAGTYLPSITKTISGKEQGLDVVSDYTFQTGGAALMGDFSLSKNKPGIRLSFGAVYNMTKVSGVRTYHEPTYDLDLGYLNLEFTPKLPVSPYLGFVFGNFKKAKRAVFALEIGALYHGSPQVTFTGDGRISPTANESNEEIIENNVKSLQFYPYANLQLNFNLKK